MRRVQFAKQTNNLIERHTNIKDALDAWMQLSKASSSGFHQLPTNPDEYLSAVEDLDEHRASELEDTCFLVLKKLKNKTSVSGYEYQRYIFGRPVGSDKPPFGVLTIRQDLVPTTTYTVLLVGKWDIKGDVRNCLMALPLSPCNADMPNEPIEVPDDINKVLNKDTYPAIDWFTNALESVATGTSTIIDGVITSYYPKYLPQVALKNLPPTNTYEVAGFFLGNINNGNYNQAQKGEPDTVALVVDVVSGEFYLLKVTASMSALDLGTRFKSVDSGKKFKGYPVFEVEIL